MMAMAGGVGAAQIALVKANRPKLQKFDTGGIVLGNSFRGDNVLARVNSGEMILNRRQQQSLFDAVDSNNLGGDAQTIVIPLYLDGDKIAEATVERVNNRHYIISQASVL